GKALLELAPSRLVEPTRYYLEETLQAGEVHSFEFQFPFRQQMRDFEARVTVCGAKEVLGIVRDVTERKPLEAEVIEISARERRPSAASSVCSSIASPRRGSIMPSITDGPNALKSGWRPTPRTSGFASRTTAAVSVSRPRGRRVWACVSCNIAPTSSGARSRSIPSSIAERISSASCRWRPARRKSKPPPAHSRNAHESLPSQTNKKDAHP